ncbi:hypothetical protein D3C87_175250 [compost metagenome]
MMKSFGVFLVLIGGFSFAEARVFNINKETFAGYFSIGGGSSLLGSSAFDKESGSGISFSAKPEYNYQGEFGFVYARPHASLRFGIEILKPQSISTTAKNSTDDLYTNQSDILGFAPKLTFDVNLHSAQTYRSFVAVGVGLANITLKNAYKLTAAGQTAFPGVSDHSIEAKGSATSLTGSLGYEGLLTDTTTLLFEMGYRQLSINNLKYTKSATTFTGAKDSGDAVLDSDGAQRELNLGGFFVSLGFRFYL